MNTAHEVWKKLDDTSRALVCALAESKGGFSHPPTPQTRLSMLKLVDHHAVTFEEGFRAVLTPLGYEVAEVGSDAAFETWCALTPELKDGLARLSNMQRWIPDCFHAGVFNELCRRKLACTGPAGGVIDGYLICPWGMRVWLSGKATVLS